MIKDIIESKNSIKHMIVVIETFCRAVDVHNKKQWISCKMEYGVCQNYLQTTYNPIQSQNLTCNHARGSN